MFRLVPRLPGSLDVVSSGDFFLLSSLAVGLGSQKACITRYIVAGHAADGSQPALFGRVLLVPAAKFGKSPSPTCESEFLSWRRLKTSRPGREARPTPRCSALSRQCHSQPGPRLAGKAPCRACHDPAWTSLRIPRRRNITRPRNLAADAYHARPQLRGHEARAGNARSIAKYCMGWAFVASESRKQIAPFQVPPD